MGPLQASRKLRQRPTQRAHQRCGAAFGERDLQTPLPAGRGDLRAREAPADHQHPARPGGQPFSQAPGVVTGAQGEHPVQGGLRVGPGPRPGPGGDQHPVVGQRLTVSQQHPLPDRVEPGGAHPQPPLRIRIPSHL